MFDISFFYILVSLLTSIFILINLRYLSNLFKLIDFASKNKIHVLDTPKFGFFLSLIILINIIFFFFFVPSQIENFYLTLYIFSFSFLGYLDDIYNISVMKRFFFSLVITSIFFSINPNYYFVSDLFSNYFNYFLLIFFTLGFIHLVNISDGINGLVPSLFLYSCIYYLLKGYDIFNTFFLILIITSIISATIFIIPNFFGFCFLGNSGSYFVSILISVFYMELYTYELVEYSDILLIFLIPLIDGIRVTFRRIINRGNPFQGDLTHIHHLVRNDKFKTFLYFLMVFIPSSINFFFENHTVLIAFISIFTFLLFFMQVRKNQNK